MPADYGYRRRRRLTRGQVATLLLAAAVALGFCAWALGGAYLRHRGERIALARDWAIDGPPCPMLSRAEFLARHVHMQPGVDYDGAQFYRQTGHMECSPIAYGGGRALSDYAVCQFTGPNVVRVTTRRGEWFFAPGVGRPATVSTADDQARCVLAADFRLK